MDKPTKSASVINFNSYSATNARKKKPILSVELYKETGTNTFSYSMQKRGKLKVADDFVAYALAIMIEDIVGYIGDPEQILELTQEIQARLGFEELDYDGEEGEEDDL